MTTYPLGGGARTADSPGPLFEQPSLPPQLTNSMTLAQVSFGRRAGGSARAAPEGLAGSGLRQAGGSSKGWTALYVPSTWGLSIVEQRLDRMQRPVAPERIPTARRPSHTCSRRAGHESIASMRVLGWAVAVVSVDVAVLEVSVAVKVVAVAVLVTDEAVVVYVRLVPVRELERAVWEEVVVVTTKVVKVERVLVDAFEEVLTVRVLVDAFEEVLAVRVLVDAFEEVLAVVVVVVGTLITTATEVVALSIEVVVFVATNAPWPKVTRPSGNVVARMSASAFAVVVVSVTTLAFTADAWVFW